ncbi:HAMP domain-containing sensor histidine kinase [Agromyces sp. SYSU T0242]|uniref:HAMP domain-containing sensor histidine kinase n=1 Tax=Agromyces litoreus TaxID=3158561 RepID=UPI0033957CBC
MNATLRSRMVALGVGSAVAVLVLLSIPVGLIVGQDAREDADRSAQFAAESVVVAIDAGADDAESVADELEQVDERFTGVAVTVVQPDGEVLGAQSEVACTVDATSDRDAGAPPRDGPTAESSPDGGPPAVEPIDGGRRVVLTTETAAGIFTVCADASTSAWLSAVAARMGTLAAAALGVLVVVAIVALLIARRVTRHLAAAAVTADRLANGDLDARVPDAGPPEVRRVGDALNRLAERIEELLQFERETAADLSHRLRTPLTAVRLDVEALPASSGKAELELHVAQLERTLTAVIRAARRPQREGAMPSCDAATVARDRFAYWAPLMEDQGREASISTETAGEALVRCSSEDLSAALDALLENAVAHTADGTPVAVVVADLHDGRIAVDVRDRGHGVPPEALERGRSDRGSTGLGLDIARSCAEASGGELDLLELDGWATVRLVLGR